MERAGVYWHPLYHLDEQVDALSTKMTGRLAALREDELHSVLL
jgi:hypothetical protein